MCWDDVLHDGPVPGRLSSEEFAFVRATFLADGTDASVILKELQERDRRLIDATGPIVLWFEHDLYDQLQLIQVIDRLKEHRDVFLVPEDTFIAERELQELTAVLKTAAPLRDDQRKAAEVAWEAFAAERPDGAAALIEGQELSPLPHLRGALVRWLESFPDDHGVGRTERVVLELLESHKHTGMELFHSTNRMEEAAFRGDWSFWLLLSGMNPELVDYVGPDMIRGQWAITERGRAVLGGLADGIEIRGIDTWRGGTHLTTENGWRWAQGRLKRY